MLIKRIHLAGVMLILLSCYQVGNGMSSLSRSEAEEFFNNDKLVELAIAAAKGNVKKIDKLVSEGVDVNARGKGDMTPLLWMMKSKNKEGFERLLEHGANPNIPADAGGNAKYSVMEVAAMAEDPEFLKLALDHGGDPNLVDKHVQENLLYVAITNHRKKNLELLIDAGANVDFQNRVGNTPLHAAASTNQYQLVYTLLKAGADYTITNNFDKTFVYFIENNNIDPGHELYQWREKVIKFLRERGVEVNPRIP